MKHKAITKSTLELDESEAKNPLDMTQNSLIDILEIIDTMESFVPDVIFIDYPYILKPKYASEKSEKEEEFREKIWDVLKKMALRHNE